MPPPPSDARRARLFRNNRSQAVRIPADWEMPGEAVTIRRDGVRLILEPERAPGLLGLVASWEPLGPGDALPEIDDPVPAPEDEPRAHGRRAPPRRARARRPAPATCSTPTSCRI